MPKAISIMKEINEGPINFNEIGYADNDILGRKILYKNYKSKGITIAKLINN